MPEPDAGCRMPEPEPLPLPLPLPLPDAGAVAGAVAVAVAGTVAGCRMPLPQPHRGVPDPVGLVSTVNQSDWREPRQEFTFDR